jgi:hypothetical protein
MRAPLGGSLTVANHEWLRAEAERRGMSASQVLDELIEGARILGWAMNAAGKNTDPIGA